MMYDLWSPSILTAIIVEIILSWRWHKKEMALREKEMALREKELKERKEEYK